MRCLHRLCCAASQLPWPVAVFATLLVASPLRAAEDGWQVEARNLPIPAAASQPLRDLVATGLAMPAQQRAVVPATDEEWRALIDAMAATRKVSIGQLGQSLNATIRRAQIAQVPVHEVEPAVVPKENAQRLFIYLHGGAYVFGGGDAAVLEGAMISALSGIRVVSVDYRMPPDHPSPAAVEDVVAVYKALLTRYQADAIGMGGTSAGGGLTLSVVQALKSAELPLPGALYLGTPWTDLSKTSDTLYTNEYVDRVLITYDGILEAAAKLYAGEKSLKDPSVSPVYGDFSDFPPAYLVTGTRDMLLSDTIRVHRKLKAAGVETDLNVFEGMSHAEYARLTGSTEWNEVYSGLTAFLMTHLRAPR